MNDSDKKKAILLSVIIIFIISFIVISTGYKDKFDVENEVNKIMHRAKELEKIE